MSYTSVQEIINAGITNMEVIVDNVAHDDDSVSVTGVDWFTFKDVVASTIYASGNSFLGFGSNSEHLKINRRDTKMWYLYREEGIIGVTKFLKIRWRGYSHYNATSESNLMIYDIIIFDNGNIFIHFDTIPTNDFTGTFSLTHNITYNYVVNSEQTDVLFTYDATTDTYSVSYEVPFISSGKWLIRKEGEIFTRVDEVIQSLGIIEVNALLFQENGVYAPFSSEELVALGNPEVLYWDEQDNGVIPKLIVKARPIQNQQLITEPIQLTNDTILGIEMITVDCDGDINIAVSFDNKTTWKAWNGTSWVNLDSQFSGMSKSTIETVGVEAWAELFTGATEMFIRVSFTNVNQILRQIYINFLN